jgi:HAD superfamily hydrolase (TIGR01509 family)
MRPGPLQAVLFDMDGVVVDSEPLWFVAEQEVMARLGADWTTADQLALIGGSLGHSVGYLARRARRPASPEQIADWLMTAMTRLMAERGVPVMPGAVELISQVQAAGVAAGLVTSSERIIMDAVLAGLAGHGVRFDVTVCADDVRTPKPDPEPYLVAAGLLGVDAARCVAIEDSAKGAESARAAGCAVIVVPSFEADLGHLGVVVPTLIKVNLAMLAALAARHPAQKPHQARR